MEVVFTLCRIISSFSVDILYEVSMVNRLFNFDLNKKNVVLKDGINRIMLCLEDNIWRLVIPWFAKDICLASER